jgi:hypothetical protein
MRNLDPTPEVSGRYGAPMGRPDGMIDDGEPLYLRRIRINSGGYDDGGAYWGLGAPLYAYGTGDGDWKYLRARSRDDAKAKIRDQANVPPEQVRFIR